MNKIIKRRGSAFRSWAVGPLVVLAAMLPGHGQAACKVSSIEMPVTLVGTRAVATIGINGTDVRLMVDSGAFYSFLTHAAAQQLKLKVGSLPWGMRIDGLTGEVEAGLTTVDRLKLRDGEVPDVDFVVGGNDEAGTMGVMGRNILAFTDIEYDLANGMIRLMFPNDDCRDKGMAYWAGDKPVSELSLLREERPTKIPAIQAVAELNDKKMRVLFDTGARSMLTLSAAKRAGITAMKPAGKVRGAGRGEAEAWTAEVDSFALGLEKVSNIRLPVADFELSGVDMLLGIDFFLSHRIYVSKKQRRMYFTYNGGPVFALSAVQNALALAGPQAASPASAAIATPTADLGEANDAAGYARRGAAALARLDFKQALADLNQACAMEPQNAEYFLRRGTVYEQMRQRQPALKDYDEALRLDPSQPEARLHRAWLRWAATDRTGAQDDLQVLDRGLAPQSHQRLQLAQLYERLGQPEQALAQWDQWIPAHPYDTALASVLNSRCWWRTLLNVRLDQAVDDCDQAIDLQDKNANYVDSRGWLRLRRGELRKSLADYERALKLKPDLAWALYGRGIVRGKLGEAEAGAADLAAARKLQATIDTQAARYGLAAELKSSAVPSPESSGN